MLLSHGPYLYCVAGSIVVAIAAVMLDLCTQYSILVGVSGNAATQYWQKERASQEQTNVT